MPGQLLHEDDPREGCCQAFHNRLRHDSLFVRVWIGSTSNGSSQRRAENFVKGQSSYRVSTEIFNEYSYKVGRCRHETYGVWYVWILPIYSNWLLLIIQNSDNDNNSDKNNLRSPVRFLKPVDGMGNHYVALIAIMPLCADGPGAGDRITLFGWKYPPEKMFDDYRIHCLRLRRSVAPSPISLISTLNPSNELL